MLLPQRYKFSSKSQPKYLFTLIVASCCCYRKGTNFQANHNLRNRPHRENIVVVATAKVQIFKQITTPMTTSSSATPLLLLPQRYKFSSKSQPTVARARRDDCCCCYRKGTNFQANHNSFHSLALKKELLLLPQRYKFSSKSQPTVKGLDSKNCCCCYRKGTNFQANHNIQVQCRKFIELLLLPQRYKFSSKSQRFSASSIFLRVVVATAKVQIFKQITTNLAVAFVKLVLLLLPQRYKFSSKSQQTLPSLS